MCPTQLTGADLYALCADAWMEALKRSIRLQEDGEKAVLGKACGVADIEYIVHDGDELYGSSLYGSSSDLPDLPPEDKIALVSTSMSSSEAMRVAGSQSGKGSPDMPTTVLVSQLDFTTALTNLVPSLSFEELQKYERLRDHYQGAVGVGQ